MSMFEIDIKSEWRLKSLHFLCLVLVLSTIGAEGETTWGLPLLIFAPYITPTT